MNFVTIKQVIDAIDTILSNEVVAKNIDECLRKCRVILWEIHDKLEKEESIQNGRLVTPNDSSL